MLSSPLPAQQPAPELLSLDEAVALALAGNRPLQIASLEVEKSGDEVSAFKTRRLPQFHVSVLASSLLTPLSFEFKQGVLGHDSGGQPIPATTTEITTPRRLNAYVFNTADQPLTQLYKLHLGVRAKELAQQAEREELRLRQHDVRLQVTRLYYEIAQTQSALEESRRSVEFYTELERVTDQYLLQRVVLRSDSLEVKVRLAGAQLQTLKLHHALETAQERMNLLLGRDLRRRFAVAEIPAPSLAELDLATAQARALASRPELRKAELRTQQAEYERRLKKAEYIPDVSLSVHHFSFANLELLPGGVVSGGLSLTWEPFDWGRKRHELAQKAKNVEQATLAQRDAETQVLVDVNAQHRRVREGLAAVQVQQLAVEMARERRRVVQAQYREQAARLDEALRAEAEVGSAVADYQRALGDYWSARAELARATGEE